MADLRFANSIGAQPERTDQSLGINAAKGSKITVRSPLVRACAFLIITASKNIFQVAEGSKVEQYKPSH